MMKRQNIFYRTLIVVLPILSLLAVVLLIHRRIAFTNLIIARGDTYFYFYPYWHVAAAAFRAGHIPLWNPDLFMGAPFLANSQAGFFYPLNWPLWSLFDTPYAVSATIILHVFIAACGIYYAGRHALNLSRSGAVVAAILFAVGGYLTVQVEHVNQAQGMAWLPWIIGTAANWSWTAEHWRSAIRKGALIAVFFALQLLAGHTQTTFITGIGMGIWVGVQLLRELYVWYDDWQKTPRTYPPVEKKPINPLRLIIIIGLILGIGVIVAAIIATIQLAPTLELTQLSRRQGGLDLDEALSFSLHPLLFARAMLPGYGQLPYGEYISYLPIVGIILAIIGIAQGGKNRHVWPPFVLAMIGLLFAFGEFNPLFSNVIINLPGFNLFRVPARWLVLYALGFAFLGGIGWDQLGRISSAQEVRRAVFWGMLIVVTLMALVPVSDYFGQTSVPMPPESPAQDAIYQLWLGWFLELGCVLLFFWMVTRHSARWRWFLFVPIVISLMMGANTIQQEALTTPEAYYDIRQSVARLQLSAEAARQANQPVPRFLSMSKGTFDPGDQGEIDSIYTDQLTKEQLYRYTVTVKDREIIAPNLTMIYGLSAADGFDGGLLPLYDYAATASLLLPEDVETIDGRLRELLVDFPPAKWLDLFGVRYLIADRTSQQEHTFEGVRATFDVLQKVTLQPNESLNIGELPNYISAELWIVATGNPGKVRVSAGPSTDEWRFEPIGNDVWRAKWSQPGTPDQIELIADQGEWEIAGATLVDPLNNTHSQLVLGNYATTHIGDVKVYENLDPLPRAFIVHSWQLTTTVDAAVSAMASADFDPRQQAVLQVETPKVVLDPEPVRPKPTRDKEMDEDELKQLEAKTFEEEQKLQQERQALIEKLTLDQLKPITISVTAPSTATITSYAPEKIEIQTNSSADGLLVLTEAYYPSWQVSIDGKSAEVEKVDGMFRGVKLPAGDHQVTFTFVSQSLQIGEIVTAGGLLLLFGALLASALLKENFWKRG